MIRTRPRFPFWFLAAIAIIPLVYSNATVDPAFTLRAVLLAVLTLTTIFATRKQPLRTSPLLWIWYIYAAFNVISIFVAQNSGEAIYEASLTLLYGAWLFAAMQMVTKEFLPKLLRTVAILGFIVAFVTLFQYLDLGFNWIPGGAWPYGTMTMKNMMSSFLFLALPATLYIALTDTKRWSTFGLVAFTMSVFVLLVAQTRAVWLACAIGLCVAAVAFALSGAPRTLWEPYAKRIQSAGILAAACLIAIFVFNVAPRTGPRAKTAAEKAGTLLNYQGDTSANMRLTVWKKSLAMFRDHPVLGVGAGNWKVALPGYGLAGFPSFVQDGSQQWTETHNDYLAAFSETGIGGGLAYLALFVAALYLAIRSLRQARNPHDRILAILMIAMVCGFAIISFFDFPKQRVEHTMLFLLWLSILPLSEGASRNVRARNAIPRYTIAALVIPALLLSIQRFTAETHEKTLLEARMDHDWNTEIAECNKIYNPRLLSLDALATPILYYKAEAEFMEQNYPAALRDNLEALRAHPNHFYTLNNIGTNYVKLGNFRVGEVFYKRALAISPNFEESLLNLAAVYYNRKEFDSARMFLLRCDTSQPGTRAQAYARVLFRATQ
ncbi:MAG TPA: O-antigen ligase family protein [Candidatus Kapabacteria bacterium]|nr:O-antigen ligase family protein [Candidatus Kapabacteria bacterium]